MPNAPKKVKKKGTDIIRNTIPAGKNRQLSKTPISMCINAKNIKGIFSISLQ